MQRRKRRLLGGVEQRNQPAVGQPFLRSGTRGRRDLLGAQPLKQMNIIHHQPTGFIRRQKMLIKLAGQGRSLGIQRF
ncbi:hypothetical protein D3C85_1803620 [compost metagenome]